MLMLCRHFDVTATAGCQTSLIKINYPCELDQRLTVRWSYPQAGSDTSPIRHIFPCLSARPGGAQGENHP